MVEGVWIKCDGSLWGRSCFCQGRCCLGHGQSCSVGSVALGIAVEVDAVAGCVEGHGVGAGGRCLPSDVDDAVVADGLSVFDVGAAVVGIGDLVDVVGIGKPVFNVASVFAGWSVEADHLESKGTRVALFGFDPDLDGILLFGHIGVNAVAVFVEEPDIHVDDDGAAGVAVFADGSVVAGGSGVSLFCNSGSSATAAQGDHQNSDNECEVDDEYAHGIKALIDYNKDNTNHL